jgi:hypothetical protein
LKFLLRDEEKIAVVVFNTPKNAFLRSPAPEELQIYKERKPLTFVQSPAYMDGASVQHARKLIASSISATASWQSISATVRIIRDGILAEDFNRLIHVARFRMVNDEWCKTRDSSVNSLSMRHNFPVEY